MDFNVLQYASDALITIVSGPHLIFLAIGVFVGLIVGMLPGLGGIAGMALILPFIYGLDPGAALGMMVGMAAVTTTSDTFPSVLMGIPGSSGSQATVVDGFPMAKRGEAARALGAAFTASMFGGVFGAVVLTFALVAARPILLSIGFAEQLMLVLFALTLVGMLTGPSMLKGLAACAIGLLIGAIGASTATGELRMTFGMTYLIDGVPLIVVALGLFAIPEIIDVLRRHGSISNESKLGRGLLDGVFDTLRHKWLVLRCAMIGSVLGALPGLGGTVIDWIAYGHVVQTTRGPNTFGRGDIRGVIAPESANNAKEGGALVPTLLLGIPGSGTMALLLGGLAVIGVTPGRSMVTTNIDLSYVIIWSIALANILGALICIAIARPIAALTTIRYSAIAPFMIVLIFFAAFQATRSWYDLGALIIAGVIGVYMKRFGWSRAAVLIGFVLSRNLEAAFYRAIQIYSWDIFLRPISLALMGVVLISLFFVFRRRAVVSDDVAATTASSDRRLPQVVFACLMLGIVLWYVQDVRNLRFLASIFPLTVAGIAGGLIAFVLLVTAVRPRGAIMFDGEAEARASGTERASMLRYLFWILLLPAIGLVVGFYLAALIFVALFLRIEGRAALWQVALGVIGIGTVLAVLGQALTLRYPQGFLQPYLSLPASFL